MPSFLSKKKSFWPFSEKARREQPTSEILFYGRNGEEAEEFVRAVRKWGFTNEKLANSKALADFASTCFTGAALRWYETLDESTKRDWDILRKAILLQYPHAKSVEHSFIDQSPFVPTPAAAPPLFVNASYTGKPADILAGRLRFIAELPSSSGYISRTALNGLFEVTTDRSNALQIRIDTSRTMQPLQITNSYPEMPNLGITWYDGLPEWTAISDKNATLCATSRDLQNKSTPVYYRGPTQINVWAYSPDGELKPSWLGQDYGPQSLETATYITGKGVVFIPNFARFSSAGRSGYSKGRLVLEPLAG